MNISKIMKMTVKEFLLTLINEANTPLECKVESVECNVESKESNAGRPPVGSCLRDDSMRDDIAGVIDRMLAKALDTCFNRFDVDGICMNTARMLILIAEVLVDFDLMPEDYNLKDYHKLLQKIAGFENTNYKTLAGERIKVSKLIDDKDVSMKIAIRGLTKWFKEDVFIRNLISGSE